MRRIGDKEYISINQAAERIGVSKSVLRAWRYNKTVELPHIKVGGILLYEYTGVEDYLKSIGASDE